MGDRAEVGLSSRAAISTMGLAAAAISSSGRAEPPATSDEGARILFAGCFEVLEGPACLVRPGTTLRFWAPGQQHDDIEIRIRDAPIEATMTRVLDGFAADVALPNSDRSFRIGVASKGPFLDLLVLPSTDAVEEVVAAEDRRREQGGLDDATAMADRGSLSHDPWARARFLGLRARIEMQRARFDNARQLLLEAIAEHRAVGSISGQLHDLTPLAFLHIYLDRNLGLARAALEQARRVPALDPEELAKLPYYEGRFALAAGDLLGALSSFDRAARDAERLGLRAEERDAKIARIDVLTTVGRCEEALRMSGEVRALVDDDDVRRRAEVFANLGWFRLVCRRQRGDESPDPTIAKDLESALSLFRSSESPIFESSVLADIARAHLAQNDLGAAERALAESETAAPDVEPWLRAGRMRIQALILAKQGKADEAVDLLESLRTYAEVNQLPFRSWEALATAASVLREASATAGAQSYYARADTSLDDVVALVPLGIGRDSFTAARAEFTREYIGVLLSMDRTAQALAVAVRSQARNLRLLDVAGHLHALPGPRRAKWEAAVDRLRSARRIAERLAESHRRLARARDLAPLDRVKDHDRRMHQLDLEISVARTKIVKELNDALAIVRAHGSTESMAGPIGDEVVLVYDRLPKGVVGFVWTKDSVRAVVFEDFDASSSGTANRLVSAFTEEVRAAGRVVIISSGEIQRVDLHAALIDGRPLSSSKPVSYGLPIGRDPGKRGTRKGRASALVVAVDRPGAPLPNAFKEAQFVADRFRSDGWKVTHLEGSQATRDAVLSALQEESLAVFHFAGHAVSARDDDGWESRFLLEGGDIAAGDVLSLGHVPTHVVLSACSGGAASGRDHGGLGIAQAFMLSGVEDVVASIRDVDDLAASNAMKKFYETTTWGEARGRDVWPDDLPGFYRKFVRW